MGGLIIEGPLYLSSKAYMDTYQGPAHGGHGLIGDLVVPQYQGSQPLTQILLPDSITDMTRPHILDEGGWG